MFVAWFIWLLCACVWSFWVCVKRILDDITCLRVLWIMFKFGWFDVTDSVGVALLYFVWLGVYL